MNTQACKLIQELASGLEACASELVEMGCTCQDRSLGHQRGCVGERCAKPYDRLARKARNTLTREAAKRLSGATAG